MLVGTIGGMRCGDWPKMDLKWRKTDRGIDGIHDAEADSRKGPNPTFLITTYMIPDGLVDHLVSAFAGTIGFQIVRG